MKFFLDNLFAPILQIYHRFDDCNLNHVIKFIVESTEFSEFLSSRKLRGIFWAIEIVLRRLGQKLNNYRKDLYAICTICAAILQRFSSTENTGMPRNIIRRLRRLIIERFVQVIYKLIK